MKLFESSLVCGLAIGSLAFVVGFIGPIVFMPESNLGPLLGIVITGPLGFVLGTLFGLIVGAIRERLRLNGKNLTFINKLSKVLIIGSVASAVLFVVGGSIYRSWYDSKYSTIVESGSDLLKRDPSLRRIDGRGLSEADLALLPRFQWLSDLDCDSGWGVEEMKMTDEGLRILSALDLPHLEQLMLGYGSRFGDAGVRHIAAMKSLKYLSLEHCQNISDQCLADLAHSNLETLDLRGCNHISDEGLAHLQESRSLMKLMIGGCDHLTAKGISNFRQAIPSCEVDLQSQ